MFLLQMSYLCCSPRCYFSFLQIDVQQHLLGLQESANFCEDHCLTYIFFIFEILFLG